MNLKRFLFLISIIIQLSVCHPILSGTSQCAHKNDSNLNPYIEVDCEGAVFVSSFCENFKGNVNISSVSTVAFRNCQIADYSDILNQFSNMSELGFMENNTLPSADLSAFSHLSAFKSFDSKLNNTALSMNATELDCFFIKNSINITSILLKNASKLEIFAIQKTMVSSLPADLFENSTNLQVVLANMNKIENIDTINWPNSVHWMDFSSNNVSQLTNSSFRNFTNLQALMLSANEIVNVEADTFSELNNLFFLQLNRNHIKEIRKNTLKGLNNVIWADFSENNITSIESSAFESTPNLVMLNLHHNNISSLNQDMLTGLNRLAILNLERTLIRELTAETFGNLTELRILDMRFGSLQTVDFNAFANLPKLGMVNLVFNNISRLVKMAPTTWNSNENKNTTFRGDLLNKADEIDLEWITPIIEKRGRFLSEEEKQFFLGGENFYNLKKFAVDQVLGMYPGVDNETEYGLKMLYLPKNQLTEIEKNVFAEFKSLKELDLSDNPIVTLHSKSFAGLGELKTLLLEGCSLTSLDFSIFAPLTQLEQLDLSFNKLRTITAAPLPSVKTLMLHDNALKKFPIKKSDLPNLEINNSNFDHCSEVELSFVDFEFKCDYLS